MVHFILLLACVLSIITLKVNNKRWDLFFGFIVLFIFGALRINYGTDYASYRAIFSNAKLELNPANIEAGYYELNRAFPSFQLLIATLTLCYLIAIYFLIREYVPNNGKRLAFFIFVFYPYYYLMSLSAIRQTLATTIFLFALMITKKKTRFMLVLYILLILVAFYIHKSAIVLLPIYFIYNCSEGRTVLKLETILFWCIPLIGIVFTGPINGLIQSVIRLLNNPNYLYYLENYDPESFRSLLLTLVYYVYFMININRVDKKTHKVVRMYMLSLVLSILSYRYAMLSRLGMYFEIFGVVAIPATIESIKPRIKGKSDYIINVYFFPYLMILIMLLRYVSFFNTSIYASFVNYTTILN